MARKEKTQTMKVPVSLVQRSARHAEALGWSFNQFGEEAIRIICDMIEDPSLRTTPRPVILLDAMKTDAKPLTKNPPVAHVIHLHAAEDPAQMQPPAPRKT